MAFDGSMALRQAAVEIFRDDSAGAALPKSTAPQQLP